MSDAVARREFLQTSLLTSAAVAGVALSAQSGLAATAAEPLRLRKALKWSMVKLTGSLSEQFNVLKEIGYEGIDIDSHLDHAQVQQAVKDSGLIVHGVVDYVHWAKPLSHPDPAVRAEGVAGLKQALHDCKAYGGTTVLLVPAVVNKEVSYADAYTRSQAEIRQVLPLAAELKIKILIENVWNNFLLSPLELVRYIDEFESPWIGSYFDVGNLVNYGWPEQWIRILGKRIGKLDIKEFSRSIADKEGRYAGFRAKIGEGDCDWPAVLAALREIGYSGWATAEVSGGDREALADISTRMTRIFTGYGA